MAAEARFGLPEVKRGLFPGGRGTYLPLRVPLGLALELLLTGDLIDARRAYEIGLVNAVVAPGAVLDRAVDLAERIAANRTCGHIVFVDNTAAHQWVKRVLVASGVPEKRIAVLNAITAKAAADRQKIAREFNGDAEAGLVPQYDVVIANAIAYEGIDLQTRTCAIHHLDLPWELVILQ